MRSEGKSIVIQYTEKEETYVEELSNYLESNIKEKKCYLTQEEIE